MFLIPAHATELLDDHGIRCISLLGNVHRRRWGWNPFDPLNAMTQVTDTIWEYHCPLEGRRLPDVSGQYSVRFVVNHNPQRILKADPFSAANLCWQLHETLDGKGLHNINFTVRDSQGITFRVNTQDLSLQIVPSSREESVQPVSEFTSYQLNGFIWDEASMFEKFDPRIPGRSFQKVEENHWIADVPLSKTGGIDFRADGVYQFLISANQSEDFGFGSLNDGTGDLVQGTGFSSSHGGSRHSGSTVRVYENGSYRFHLKNPTTDPSIEVENLDPMGRSPALLNDRLSFQLLGSIFDSDQFDPTNPSRVMLPTENSSIYRYSCLVTPGFHSVNVAISGELFLDTMGIGCWLNLSDKPASALQCQTWHGKPHEINICFYLASIGQDKVEVEFLFHSENDRLDIQVCNGDGSLQPLTMLDELSLVGSFDSPLVPWAPESPKNLMASLGGGRFERVLQLSAGKTYNYKYVANRSPWLITFADYELDCYGSDFIGQPELFGDPRLSALRRFGRLTSHGNPPALEFTAMHSGPYHFYADLTTGCYSVAPFT